MKLTICTALYNREVLIKRLYESLRHQTNQEFEWIVVDDGSVDKSYSIVQSFLQESNEFPIRIYKQKNSGKHVAINNGINHATGDLFFIVDSDDYLPKDAVEKIYKQFQKMNGAEKIAGISAIKAYTDENVVGTSFNSELDYIDISNLERKKYGIIGDRAEVYYTSVLRKYMFPVFENENFISEATVWNKIAYDGYKLRFINEIVYYCQYLEGGLSKNIQDVFLKNWKGYSFYVNQEIKFRKGIYNKLTIIFAYVKLAKMKGIGLQKIKKQIDNAPMTLLIMAMFLQIPYRIVSKILDN